MNIRANNIRQLNRHIINRRRDRARAHGARVPRRDGHEHGVDVGHGEDEHREDPGDPGAARAGEDFEGDEAREHPPLAEGGEEEALVDFFGEVGYGEEVDDEDCVGGDGEEVGFEGWGVVRMLFDVEDGFFDLLPKPADLSWRVMYCVIGIAGSHQERPRRKTGHRW